MAKVLLKKSSVSDNAPGTGDLEYGELALNYADGRLYYKNSSNQIKGFLDSAGVVNVVAGLEPAHDDLVGFVANEHIDHSAVTLTAGSGLTGGGNITTSRTFNIGEGTGITVSADAIATNDAEIVHDNLSGFVANEHIDHSSVSVTAGSGLTGGGDITTTRTLNIGEGTGITVSADAIATNDAEIIHDNLSGFVADEHVAHSTVSITAGSGLTGGGTIAATRTLNIGEGTGITVSADAIATNDAEIVHDNLSGFVADEHIAHSGVTLTAGAGLTGGGTIAASRTFNIGAGTGVTVNADNIAIGQDVATTADVTFNSVTTTNGLIVSGDLQVTGTTTTVNSQSLEVTDNMIYMNAGESDGSPTQSIDVGWAANVNDGGSYTHVGMFRDATDDRFKVFGTYNPEPDAAPEINTGHASFALADFQADTFYGNLTGNVTGNASTATALQTARTIGGVSFNGTSNINLPGVNATGNQNTSGNAATATALATARTIGGVSFNGTSNINLPGVNATGNQDTTGSAATLTTARTIGGVSFDGSANINLPGVNATGNQNTTGSAATLTTARTIGGVSFNGSANINLPGVNTAGNQNTSGNAATATTLATGRNFSASGDATASNVSFNGSSNVNLTLTLATVNSNVGTFGSGTQVPVITVDGKGRLTAVSTATIAGVTGVDYDSADGSLTVATTGGDFSTNITLDPFTTADLTENTNLYYTTTRANSAIDARVTKSFVDALNVDADTLDGEDGSYYRIDVYNAAGTLLN